MLKPKPFATAVTIVSVGLYIICRIIAIVAPDLLYIVGQSWFHTFSVDSVRSVQPFNMGLFINGGITFGILAWATGFSIASLYNKFAK